MEIILVKKGLNYVDMLGGVYERWGDYFGIQRKYNEPGHAWNAGYYSLINGNAAIWVSEVINPDLSNSRSLASDLVIAETLYPDTCTGYALVTPIGGQAPYAYNWSDDASVTFDERMDLCEGTYAVTVSDLYNCKSVEIATIIASGERPEDPFIPPANALYPNPMLNDFTMYVVLKETMVIYIDIYDLLGQKIKALYHDLAKKGNNLFSFNTMALSEGSYIVKVYTDSEEIMTQKIVKTAN